MMLLSRGFPVDKSFKAFVKTVTNFKNGFWVSHIFLCLCGVFFYCDCYIFITINCYEIPPIYCKSQANAAAKIALQAWWSLLTWNMSTIYSRRLKVMQWFVLNCSLSHVTMTKNKSKQNSYLILQCCTTCRMTYAPIKRWWQALRGPICTEGHACI